MGTPITVNDVLFLQNEMERKIAEAIYEFESLSDTIIADLGITLNHHSGDIQIWMVTSEIELSTSAWRKWTVRSLQQIKGEGIKASEKQPQ